MFELSQIPLFPFESTSITVTTTVWIGVMITVFFNLRFGWTLSALVVPGYVVPLLMSRPTTAIVILVEGMITYFLAIWISDAFRNRSYWSSLFGRDRFFLIVVTSILVRAIADGWLLPMAGRCLVEQFSIDLDYRNELGSFGLIAVALLANYFWKPGIRSGLMTMMTSVGLTWAVVAWVLVPLTNFNVGSFHFLYEDISVSMLTSPKAYVIILVTGWFASWMNLRYSWDFNGILIPALIGLLWAQPERILMSLVEAGLVLLVGHLLIKSTSLRNVGMQGGRKLAFYFTICFLLRFVLAHFLSQAAPGVKVTDFFGMGYLLSTLLAIKVDQQRVPLRITGGILQVSAVGVVAASLIGFFIDMAGSSPQVSAAVAATLAPAKVQHSQLSVAEHFKDEKLRLYRDLTSLPQQPDQQTQLQHFQSALRRLRSPSALEPVNLNLAASELARANYELTVLQQHRLLIREREPFQNRGWFMLSPNSDKDLCLLADRAAQSPWTADSAIFLSEQLGARSMAVAGSIGLSDTASATDHSRFMAEFCSTFGQEHSLTLRSSGSSRSPETRNTLAIQVAISDQLDLSRIKKLVDGFEVVWQPSTEANASPKATLLLDPRVGRKLAIRSTDHAPVQSDYDPDEIEINAAGDIWLNSLLQNVCGPDTDQYRAPKHEELKLIEKAILPPLFRLANKTPADAELLDALSAINHEAATLGYRVKLIRNDQRDEKLIVFHEQTHPNARLGWGSLVLRCGLESSCGIEVLRPQSEPQTFEFAANLFRDRKASILLVAGARHDTNRDGSSDLSRSVNRTNFINHCRQLILRELGPRPWLTLQTRAMKADINTDVAIATDQGFLSEETLSPAQRRGCESLTDSGLTVDYVDGRQTLAGYGISSRLTDIATTAANKENMSLWLSPTIRRAYQRQEPDNSLDDALAACGLKEVFRSRAELLAAATQGSTNTGLKQDLRQRMLEFCHSQDIVKLYGTLKEHPSYQFQRFYDRQTGSTLIVIADPSDQVIALLNPRGSRDRLVPVERLTETELQRFFRSRSLLLEVE